ncbi:FAD-dependent monooxygenase [Amycolatopsis umgeniensis]|uniref:2-polyprenyl-6-methoxyphenol hydroxylase-like FAD-dependent oxidoreductase n=1 Tax=Amycolatopsis umgeniensis TaxID=336628 RepID=A0A841B9C4_9PSEU|nr:FAD-dependent monooxygenase [Amycolatopsis umgeniensis]MBB5857499.1 2-polyprenyl-6-methoxyphenol hydroxylase-like FAD-dependent oxidoreductase [Amycolatopsis umgeniensis]
MDAEVIVVGAGPVGLMLAGDLRFAGADVVVLERLVEPTGESRASQLGARTMELFDQRELVHRLAAPERQRTGHFGGLPLDVGGLDSPFAGNWKVPQYETEAVLARRAVELGVDVRRGVELTAVTERADRVDLEASGAQGRIRLSARYLVGCDGGESTVRELAGFAVAREGVTRQLLRADVAGISVRDRRFERLPAGLAVAARRGDGVTRIMVHEFADDAKTVRGEHKFTELAEAWFRVTGEDIGDGVPIWVDAFDNACHLVTDYREGRVFLAGDAAHGQMPIGGQALNLGLHDAANLGWKLAAQVRGGAPAGLADSYDDERRPVAVCTQNDVRAQELLLLGGPEVESARQVLAELLAYEEVSATLAGSASGLNLRYSPGDGHSLLGKRLPPAELTVKLGSTTTTALSRSPKGLFLDLSQGQVSVDPVPGWSHRVRAVAATRPQDGPLSDVDALLVRPDGYVCWVAGGEIALESALRTWFGKERP